MAEARRAALWSPQALDDRENIWDYYVRVAGRHTAESILRDIAKVIALVDGWSLAAGSLVQSYGDGWWEMNRAHPPTRNKERWSEARRIISGRRLADAELRWR
jgi:plasmid stabilization system protein ParE